MRLLNRHYRLTQNGSSRFWYAEFDRHGTDVGYILKALETKLQCSKQDYYDNEERWITIFSKVKIPSTLTYCVGGKVFPEFKTQRELMRFMCYLHKILEPKKIVDDSFLDLKEYFN